VNCQFIRWRLNLVCASLWKSLHIIYVFSIQTMFYPVHSILKMLSSVQNAHCLSFTFLFMSCFLWHWEKTAVKVMNLWCLMHPICKEVMKTLQICLPIARFLFRFKACFSLDVRKEGHFQLNLECNLPLTSLCYLKWYIHSCCLFGKVVS